VVVDVNGHLGTVTSSARFKEAIKPMDKASEAILALKPVTFRYKHELDPDGIPQFGLVAEQVEKVNPDLVVRDADGKINTVRYEAVNAMLLNEFLKEHHKVEQQQNEIDALKAQLKEQRAFIQRVSDKVEINRPSPQIVRHDQIGN
jgi:Chaperone of endosialidase